MKDLTLEHIWKSREAISRRCDYDSKKLVQFYQQSKEHNRTKASTLKNAPHF